MWDGGLDILLLGNQFRKKWKSKLEFLWFFNSNAFLWLHVNWCCGGWGDLFPGSIQLFNPLYPKGILMHRFIHHVDWQLIQLRISFRYCTSLYPKTIIHSTNQKYFLMDNSFSNYNCPICWKTEWKFSVLKATLFICKVNV